MGTDHTVPAARLAPLVEEINRDGGLTARIGSLADYLRSEEPSGELPTWRGELRSAARAHLLPNVYSARVHQKQRRGRVEALLERHAEPLAALVTGFEWPEEKLRRAWRLLLWNGAHDSVCGCSVDQVARDVDARYDEAESIASEIRDDALQSLASRMSTAGWMSSAGFLSTAGFMSSAGFLSTEARISSPSLVPSRPGKAIHRATPRATRSRSSAGTAAGTLRATTTCSGC